MKILTFPLALLFALSLTAQQKGASPLPPALGRPPSAETFAVVVGISDYQDKAIPDLRFADRDALAFAGFLQSPAGGALDEDHLRILVNDRATGAQFANALDWLWEVVKENDRAIIYFSGHGDVERKSITQPGYLLCWDAPPRVYMAGGAFNVRDLNDVVSTLAIQNKAKVVLITDACRAGKLSGSGIGGAQATAANLAKQYANEVKILSCQPDEYSIEGEQWGGGRGAFSYHLLDGLYGMADGNSDLSIDLKEIGRYLEDNVTSEVAPHSQNPMTVGSKTEKLTAVFPEILAQLKEGKKGQVQLFTATESRGIEDDVLAAADTNIVEMYLAFKQSLKDKQFLEPATACSDFYYEKLAREPQLEKLHSSMRRNYAAALQDDAQQVLNIMLKSGLTEQVLKAAKYADLYYNYPTYLERAAELLGEGHYMYATLQARKHFFEGMVQEKSKDKRTAFRKALGWQPDMAHAMVYLTQSFEPGQRDSAEYYTQKAAALIPSWVEPFLAMAIFYGYGPKQPDKVEEMLDLAGQVDSTSVLVWFRKANFYKDNGKYKLAEKWYLKTIEETEEDICFPCAHLNLAYIYKTSRRHDEAEKYLKKAIQLDSTGKSFCFPCAYNNLGDIYRETRRYDEAEKYLKKAIQLDTTFWMAYANLGILYQILQRWEESKDMTQKTIQYGPPIGVLVAMLGNTYTHLPDRLEEAKKTLDKALEMDADSPITYFYLAQWSIKMNQMEEAWQYLEQGLEKGFGNGQLTVSDLQEEPDFEQMRKEARWGELMERYFPEESEK